MIFDGRIEAMMQVPAGISVAATNSGGGPTACAIPAGSYYWSTLGLVGGLAVALAATLNSNRPSGWTVTLSTGINGTGLLSITGTGSWSIDLTDAGDLPLLLNLGTVLTGPGTLTTAVQLDGVWFPDCPLGMDGDPKRAPIVTDKRAAMSATGKVSTLIGNKMYRHKNLRYGFVPVERAWETDAVTPRSSWERFLYATQLAQAGYTWFKPGSLVQIVNHAGTLLGADGLAMSGNGLSGWSMPDIGSIEPTRVDTKGWTGLWQIDVPQLVSNG